MTSSAMAKNSDVLLCSLALQSSSSSSSSSCLLKKGMLEKKVNWTHVKNENELRE